MQYKWTVLTVTTVGVLMSGIDGRIVVIGLPVVAAALHAGAEQAIWFTQAYIIGSTIALLFLGRVSDMAGRVKIYNLGFAIFTVGSFLTSVSPSPDFFIASRIFQGFGSAALFANSAALITDAFPPGELGKALGINQVAFRAGSMFGLTISGLILAFLNWRFLFYINIPVGIFGTVWAHKRLHEQREPETKTSMDWLGFGTFTVFIVSLLLALTYAAYGSDVYSTVAALGAVSAAFLVIFVMVERRHPHPLLDLGLLKIREFTGGVLTQLVNAVAWGAFILIVSLYLQLVVGVSPLQAGIEIIPFDLGLLVLGPISGRLSDQFGTLPFTTAGLGVVSLSLFAMSTITPTTPYILLLGYLVLGGAGMGLFLSPNMSSIMGSVPASRRGVASGLRGTFFNIGFLLSFNLVIIVLTLYLPYSQISAIIASAAGTAVSIGDKAKFSSALDKVFLVMTVINTMAIIPSLLRGKRAGLDGAADSNTGRSPEISDV